MLHAIAVARMPVMSVDFNNLGSRQPAEPRTAFDHALHELLDDFFAAQPVWATPVGFHAHDDRWPDMTEAGRPADWPCCATIARACGRLRDDGSVRRRADRPWHRRSRRSTAHDFEDDELREVPGTRCATSAQPAAACSACWRANSRRGSTAARRSVAACSGLPAIPRGGRRCADRAAGLGRCRGCTPKRRWPR